MTGRGRSTNVIVVGAGIVGLLTAAVCAARGATVTVVEQGPIPNPRSASYDQHRIVRALHVGDPATTRVAQRARRQWRAVERLLGHRLYHRIGALTVLRPEQLDAARSTIAAGGVEAELLSSTDLARRWPQIRFRTADAVLEPAAGIVLADRTLRAVAAWLARQPHVQLRPHQQARTLRSAGTVELADGTRLRGASILVAGGAWSRDLLPARVSAQVRLHRQSLLYCRVPAELGDRWARTPAIPALGDGAWLVPPVAGTQLKLTAATACRTVDAVTDHETPERWRAHLVELFTERLARFGSGWVTGCHDCYYPVATTESGALVTPILDNTAVVLAHAACGGSSFKFAPVIADTLADRLLPGGGASTVAEPVAVEVVHD